MPFKHCINIVKAKWSLYSERTYRQLVEADVLDNYEKFINIKILTMNNSNAVDVPSITFYTYYA